MHERWGRSYALLDNLLFISAVDFWGYGVIVRYWNWLNVGAGAALLLFGLKPSVV